MDNSNQVSDVFFRDIQSEILQQIQSAKRTIKIAIAYFTDSALFSLICSKAEDGISVELIISDEDANFQSQGLDFDKIIFCGGKLFISISERKSLLHNKFCVIDDNIVLTGSYNWSYKAQINDENLLKLQGFDKVTEKFLKEFERIKTRAAERHTNKNSFCLPIGFPSFDDITGGIQSGSIALFCSSSYSDITPFFLTLINNATSPNQHKAAYISFSDTKEMLTKRLLSICSGVDIGKINKATLDDSEISKLHDTKSKLDGRLDFYELQDYNINDLTTTINKLKYRTNISFVIIEGIERFVNEASRNNFLINNIEPHFIALKRLALEKNIIILCSINVETNKKRLSNHNLDLGVLEGHSDAIFNFYRAEYYDVTVFDVDNRKEFLLKMLKNRHGVLSTIKLFQNSRTKEFFEANTGDEDVYVSKAKWTPIKDETDDTPF